MATRPPSQFAVLLRQSKFASFDPAIAQAYTSYGGHAFRGNFGLKRPLPIRHRNATVTVHAVDSREQQTVWRSAEKQRRWVEMWDEAGVTPTLQSGSRWSKQVGVMDEIKWLGDSEFGGSESDDRGVGEAFAAKSSAIANIHAMSEQEFKRYLEKLRQMRPAFKEYLKRMKEPRAEPSSLWEQSVKQSIQDDFKGFRSSQAFEKYHSPTSTSIEQHPQRYGGLSYTRSPKLQSYLIQKFRPGRILQQRTSPGAGGDYIVDFAGMTPILPRSYGRDNKPIEWNLLAVSGHSDKLDESVAKFRMTSAKLAAVPNMLGQKYGLESVGLQTLVRTEKGVEPHRPNPYPPGSPQYVGHIIATKHTPRMTDTPKKGLQKFVGDLQHDGKDLVNMLGDIIQRDRDR